MTFEYRGFTWDSKTTPREIVVVDASTTTPADFYASFVASRRPCILRGKCDIWDAVKDWDFDFLRSEVGDVPMDVEVDTAEDQQNGAPTFGYGRKIRKSLSAILDAIESGDENFYITTQPIKEDCDGPKAVCGGFLRHLKSRLPAVPSILGNLQPYQINSWIGGSVRGTTTGLHHDFHDNLYVLLRGSKEFRVFPPDTPLPVTGEIVRIHANGLICYDRKIREDGVHEASVARWKLRKASNDDEEDAALEALLDVADELADEPSGPSKKIRKCVPRGETPLHFCTQGTVQREGDETSTELMSNYMSVLMQPGDILYLPASWYHEVISSSTSEGEVRGHFALNFWFYPPIYGAPFESPYVDSFWKERWANVKIAKSRRPFAWSSTLPRIRQLSGFGRRMIGFKDRRHQPRARGEGRTRA